MRDVFVLAGFAALAVACSGKDSPQTEPAPSSPRQQRDAASAPPNTPLVSPSFGPVVGSPAATRLPPAGRYAGAYTYSQLVFHTMERDTSSSISGRALLTLGDDGRVSGCVGYVSSSTYSVSKYASDDGEFHRDTTENRRLFAVGGRWTPTRGAAVVTIDQTSVRTCDADKLAPSKAMELVCVVLEANDALPTDTLACRVDPGSWLDELAFDIDKDAPAGPRALPYAEYDMPPAPGPSPWLLLGADQGLAVSADRDRGSAFDVRLTAAQVTLVDDDYRDKPRAP